MPEPTIVVTLPDGTDVLECAFCEGGGVFPPTVNGPEIETDPCPTCKGAGVNVVTGSQSTRLLCRYCNGTGRGWDENGHFHGQVCPICSGRGMNDLAAMQSSKSGTSTIWDLLHRDVVAVGRSRFESGHYADAVEACLKLVNERVKAAAAGKVSTSADGAGLMTQVFSEKDPILILDDLSTRSGKAVQIGYMQIFAGAMTGIRNPKAHANLDISADRGVHFLFLASLLMTKIDEAKGRP